MNAHSAKKYVCDKNEFCVQCSLCDVWVHKECSGLNDAGDPNMLNKILTNIHINYSCDNCLHQFDNIRSKDMVTLLNLCSRMYYDQQNQIDQKHKMELEMASLILQVDKLQVDIQSCENIIKQYQESHGNNFAKSPFNETTKVQENNDVPLKHANSW
jgi:hypothetical protein